VGAGLLFASPYGEPQALRSLLAFPCHGHHRRRPASLLPPRSSMTARFTGGQSLRASMERRRQQEARLVAQPPVIPVNGRELRRHRARQPWPRRQERYNFRNRQDRFDDGAEQLGDPCRPWRDDAVERRALAKRAGHVMISLGDGECRSLAARGHPELLSGAARARTRNCKSS